nr:uncharacterized protein LOC127315053 [Lolium perenne]
MSTRWAIFQVSVNMFQGYHHDLETRGDSGTDVAQLFDKAMDLYRRNSDGHKSFALMHCYTKLKKNHKWRLTRVLLSKGKDAIDLDAPLPTSVGRPIINKAAKAALADAASAKKTQALLTQFLIEVSSTLLSRDKKAEERWAALLKRIRVQRGKHAKVARTKWWKLKGEASHAFRERVIKEGPWEEGVDANMMWTMATYLRKVDVEEFGVTKGSRREAKDTWWWNDEVQKVIREKKDNFRCLYLDRSAANMENYKVAKKTAKRAVSEARGRAYEDLYQRLNTKEGKRDIYKMTKFSGRKTRDVNEVKCINDGEDQLLVKDEAIKRRWWEYFDNLYNREFESSTIELDDSFDDTSMCFVRRIQESEVKEALRRMKGGKAMGPNGIPIETWRGLGDIAITILARVIDAPVPIQRLAMTDEVVARLEME